MERNTNGSYMQEKLFTQLILRKINKVTLRNSSLRFTSPKNRQGCGETGFLGHCWLAL
jgi:hypothetical protein